MSWVLQHEKTANKPSNMHKKRNTKRKKLRKQRRVAAEQEVDKDETEELTRGDRLDPTTQDHTH